MLPLGERILLIEVATQRHQEQILPPKSQRQRKTTAVLRYLVTYPAIHSSREAISHPRTLEGRHDGQVDHITLTEEGWKQAQGDGRI